MMNLNLIPFAAGWLILAVVVVVLIVFRKRVANQEDDTLHVMDGDVGLVPHQVTVAHKLEVIDRWGKLLTVIVVVYGLALGAGYIYQSWVQNSNYMGR